MPITKFPTEQAAFAAAGDVVAALCHNGKPTCGLRVLTHEDGYKAMIVPERGNGVPFYLEGFELGAVVRLASSRQNGEGPRYAATQGALARITGPAFVLPSGRLVQNLVWLQPTTHNGQKDGAYLVHDFTIVPQDKTGLSAHVVPGAKPGGLDIDCEAATRGLGKLQAAAFSRGAMRACGFPMTAERSPRARAWALDGERWAREEIERRAIR